MQRRGGTAHTRLLHLTQSRPSFLVVRGLVKWNLPRGGVRVALGSKREIEYMRGVAASPMRMRPWRSVTTATIAPACRA